MPTCGSPVGRRRDAQPHGAGEGGCRRVGVGHGALALVGVGAVTAVVRGVAGAVVLGAGVAAGMGVLAHGGDSLVTHEGVAQHADAVDLDLDPLARLDEADAGRGAGEDDVARAAG